MIAPSRSTIPSPHPPSPADLKRIAAGDQQACRDLIDGWETVIMAIAKGHAARPSDIDDLIQVGRLAVYRCALKYDPSYEFPFGNYAKRAIKNSVMGEAVRLARWRRLERPLEGNVEAQTDSPQGLVVETSLAEPIMKWVLELPEPHPTIFRLLYVGQLKQRAAAKELGLSQPRVAQLHQSFLVLARSAFTA
jgi:RNA polymerase sigma factor (sigma-70 family)